MHGLTYSYLSDLLIEKQQWFESSNRYVDIVGCIVDVEIVNEQTTSQEAIAFDMWFKNKTGDFLNDYMLFMQILPHEFIKVLHEDCYEATRPKLPKAPEVTQQVVPDLNSPLESNGKKKPAKSTKKRSKSTS
jgi:hypothetical protein